jgi:hypothetical protein
VINRRETLLLALAALAAEPAHAQQQLVRIDAKCPDKDMLLEVQKAANDAIRELKDAKLVADESANMLIRISVSPIQLQKDASKYSGVSIAIVVSRLGAKQSEEVRQVVHRVIPVADYKSIIHSVVAAAPNY